MIPVKYIVPLQLISFIKYNKLMKKHLHILGIGGSFMAGVAVIAQQLGFRVTGSDLKLYPPMSDRLKDAGISYFEGYSEGAFKERPDEVIIGNALSRGNPALEYVLNNKLPYNSGAQWLAENVLFKKHVLAVSGTHGKTTTTSILVWILEVAGKKPGYLIGGAAKNFATTAQLGEGDYFVIEADEYDTAFFDKRSKFLHYRPRTLIMNNLEFDHGDIFDDLNAIKKQFQYLLRTVPSEGSVIYPENDANVVDVVARGLYSPAKKLNGSEWSYQIKNDGGEFSVLHYKKEFCHIRWSQFGEHNVKNALAAIVAATEIGINAKTITQALATFEGVRRRLDLFATLNEVSFYDDFAHHPTAIASTLSALRKKVGKARVIAVAEFASNTMKAGMHGLSDIAHSFDQADQVFLLNTKGASWQTPEFAREFSQPFMALDNVDEIIIQLKKNLKPQDHVVLLSNKSFDGIYKKIIERLS